MTENAKYPRRRFIETASLALAAVPQVFCSAAAQSAAKVVAVRHIQITSKRAMVRREEPEEEERISAMSEL